MISPGSPTAPSRRRETLQAEQPGEEPTVATAAPPPVGELVVATDGSGTHVSVGEAIAAASAGATIQLRRGRHSLPAGMRLRQPLKLVGDGRDVTELVTDDGDCIVGFEGSGRFTLSGVTLRWDGGESNELAVIDAVAGEVHIESCRVIGKKAGDEFGAGFGIRFRGSAAGTVTACEVRGATDGIVITELAEVTVTDNTCEDLPVGAGIVFRGSVGGRAEGNTSRRNADGIVVVDDAHPTLRRNTCESNQSSGISINHNAAPTVEENTCSSNFAGIQVYGDVGGIIRKNTCRRNQNAGIALSSASQATVEGNICENNRFCGIEFSMQARGIARGNTCQGSTYGIGIRFEADPEIEDNTCTGNDIGIEAASTIGGHIHRNHCNNNDVGIQLSYGKPTLDTNTCDNNNRHGITYARSGAGIARKNSCKGNEYGIYIDSDGQPSIHNNECIGNRKEDIHVEEGRQAFLVGNETGDAARRQAGMVPFDPTPLALAQRTAIKELERLMSIGQIRGGGSVYNPLIDQVIGLYREYHEADLADPARDEHWTRSARLARTQEAGERRRSITASLDSVLSRLRVDDPIAAVVAYEVAAAGEETVARSSLGARFRREKASEILQELQGRGPQ